VIRVASPETPGLAVKRGDVVVGRAQWNVAMPVDPGTVPVEASAPGRKGWRGTVIVVARATAQIEIPALGQESVAPPPPAAAGVEMKPAEGAAAFGTQRTLAVVAGAAGVLGLGVGTAFGIVSMSKGSDADTRCDANNVCDQQGVDLRKDAIDAGNVATIGF